MSLASVASAIVQSPQHLAAVCIQTNTTLSAPLTPVLNQISGAFGGMLQPVAVTIFIVLAVVGLFMVLNKKAGTIFRLMGVVLAFPIIAVLALVVWTALLAALNTSATC